MKKHIWILPLFLLSDKSYATDLLTSLTNQFSKFLLSLEQILTKLLGYGLIAFIVAGSFLYLIAKLSDDDEGLAVLTTNGLITLVEVGIKLGILGTLSIVALFILRSLLTG